MSISPASLEIHVSRRGHEIYSVDLRYTSSAAPDISGELQDRIYPSSELIPFRPLGGTDAEIDPVAAGRQLSADFYADLQVGKGLTAVLAQLDAIPDCHLHVRLFIEPAAAELQLLPWEALRRPDDSGFLFLGDRISFSRYLAPSDDRRLEPHDGRSLSVSLLVANPLGVKGLREFPPFQSDGLEEAVRAALPGLEVRAFAKPGTATFKELIAQVQQGCDVLYLACHGAMAENEAYVWLDHPDGSADRRKVSDVIEQLRELRRRPRLVVLFSCVSAGDDATFAAALGPRLAEAGAAAVLAMRGNAPLDTTSTYLAAFFRELKEHGSVDRAASFARRSVGSLGDGMIPVLFTRLRTGRIWYKPGLLGDDGSSLPDKWPTIIGRIAGKQCTPIVGPGLLEPLLGSSREAARYLADKCAYPLSPDERDDLAHVAQYVATATDKKWPRTLLAERADKLLHDQLPDSAPETSFAARLEEAWHLLAARESVEVHKVLASLPLPIYVTTNSDHLLEAALRAAGKEPRSEVCPWKQRHLRGSERHADPPPPSPDRPLVYHLFGSDELGVEAPITEDEYFAFLMGMATERDLIPPAVRTALNDQTVMFLGFQVEDLHFRVLFRAIVQPANLENFKEWSHVAVQVDPEEARIIEPIRARTYFRRYFESLANISIYWGGVPEFIGELDRLWRAHVGEVQGSEVRGNA